MANIARLHVIDETAATGTLKASYDEMEQRRGWLPNIRQTLSLKPEAMRAAELLGSAVTQGASKLGRAMEEQIATVVSAVNRCQY